MKSAPKYANWGIAVGLGVVTLGVIATIKMGYRPPPRLIMKPSFFSQAPEIGDVTFKRFYAEIGDENVVVVGLATNRDWSVGFLRGFVESARSHQREFKTAVVDSHMPDDVRAALRTLIPATQEIETNTETMEELGQALIAAQDRKSQLLVVVPNLYSSRTLEEAPLRRLEKELQFERPIFSLTSGPLALEASEEKTLDPVCLGSERDGSGTAPLGCAILQAGRGYYRKKELDSEPTARSRFAAVIEAKGASDYLVLIREPNRPASR